MIFIRSVILAVCCLFLFSACQQPPQSYAYLLSHPDALKQAVKRCSAPGANAEYCAMVERAQQDFGDLYNQWRQNPEDFGKTILQLQMLNADLSIIPKNTFSEKLSQAEIAAAYIAVVGLNPIE